MAETTNELFDLHFLFDPLFIMGSILTPYAVLYLRRYTDLAIFVSVQRVFGVF